MLPFLRKTRHTHTIRAQKMKLNFMAKPHTHTHTHAHTAEKVVKCEKKIGIQKKNRYLTNCNLSALVRA